MGISTIPAASGAAPSPGLIPSAVIPGDVTLRFTYTTSQAGPLTWPVDWLFLVVINGGAAGALTSSTNNATITGASGGAWVAGWVKASAVTAITVGAGAAARSLVTNGATQSLGVLAGGSSLAGPANPARFGNGNGPAFGYFTLGDIRGAGGNGTSGASATGPAGGGGATSPTAGFAGGSNTLSVDGQTFAGGTALTGAGVYSGGGGAGMFAAGSNGTSTSGGNGGNGGGGGGAFYTNTVTAGQTFTSGAGGNGAVLVYY